MIRVLVSACLLGERVRYDGADAASDSEILRGWLREGRAVLFCPEVAGGLGVPRPPAEIRGVGGAAVLEGSGKVVTRGGNDVTEAFLRGAELGLQAALAAGVRLAVLKENSPSCGSRFIYDGSFSGQRKAGQGVTAALLLRHGIAVFSDLAVPRAVEYLQELERTGIERCDPTTRRI
jgi:uncharacterized protein YbbK (DUF523 family)